MGLAHFVRRTRNAARLCEGPPCAKNRPREKARPKITARRPGRQVRPAEKGHKNGWAIALGGGAGNFVRRTQNAARLCEGPPCDKNRLRVKPRPKAGAPSSSSGKRPQKRVGYSLGGWGWPTSSAGLGMGPNFTTGLRVPAGCPGHSRAQKRATQLPRPKTAQWKRAKTGGM